MRYVDGAAEFVREGGRYASFLDKLSLHRLIYLIVDSVFIQGHVSTVSNVMLASVHQTFKKWSEKTVNQYAQITAVEDETTTDLGIRLFVAMGYRMYINNREEEP